MLALDHLVISSKNSTKSSRLFQKQHHIHTVTGGIHENWGTKNILAHFANNCYIEWIDIFDYTIAKQSSNPLIQHLTYLLINEREIPFQFALRTDNMAKFKHHFVRQNIPHIGPIKGMRKTNAGTTLTWKMLFPQYDYKKEALPFLIEWDQPNDVRIHPDSINDKVIPSITVSNITIERFAQIYNIPHKKTNLNDITITNCRINFSNEEQTIKFDIH